MDQDINRNLEEIFGHAVEKASPAIVNISTTKLVGEAQAADGIKVGYLPQEPDLGDAKTVREAVEAGVDAIDCAFGPLSGSTSQPNLQRVLRLSAGSMGRWSMRLRPVPTALCRTACDRTVRGERY